MIAQLLKSSLRAVDSPHLFPPPSFQNEGEKKEEETEEKEEEGDRKDEEEEETVEKKKEECEHGMWEEDFKSHHDSKPFGERE